MRVPLLGIVVVMLVAAAGCGSGSGSNNVSPTGRGSATVSASPPSTAEFTRRARRICTNGQQKVYQLVTTLKGQVYPRRFPSEEFASFYQQSAAIGMGVVAALRRLPIPSGQAAPMSSELDLMTAGVQWARAAGRAAAAADEVTYKALVGESVPARPKHPLLRQDCLFLSLGPGAGG